MIDLPPPFGSSHLFVQELISSGEPLMLNTDDLPHTPHLVLDEDAGVRFGNMCDDAG